METRTAAPLRRCAWAIEDPLLRAYHDTEWGVPEYDSRALWEQLMLDGFQAGLSWKLILQRRESLRRAFAEFARDRVARFGPRDVRRLLRNPRIIRSLAKIEATIAGARAYCAIQAAGQSFSTFAWNLIGGRPIQGTAPVPNRSPLSEGASKALKENGFRFVGPVVVYAWMQAAGMVNDHSADCFRRKEIRALGAPVGTTQAAERAMEPERDARRPRAGSG